MSDRVFTKGKSKPNFTPPGPRHGFRNTSGLSHTMQKSTAADVLEGVENDWSAHVRVSDRDEFISKMFPVEDRIIEAVLAHADVQKLYVVPANGGKDRWKAGNGRWKGFPAKSDDKLEAVLYSAFVNVANTIRQVTQSLVGGNASDGLGSNAWVDYHSKSPKSNNPEAPAIRPDCLLALTHIQNHANTLERESKKRASLNAGDGSTKDVTGLAIWWLQIIAVVEVKRADHRTWEDTVKQLIGYLRHVLREQLDRRFVFGFTLGPSKISIWVHDRSGALGTAVPVDIHKEPILFIRLIAALVCLPPDRLGFDPTMKLYISPQQSFPSYRLDSTSLAVYKTTGPYDLRWIIEMNDGAKYLTVRVLSIARASIMRGRGTVVWAVTPFTSANILESQQSQILVLKQSWRPVEDGNEGTLFTTAQADLCSYVGKISRCEDVLIHGERDETGSLIRRDLTPTTPSTAQSSKSESKKRVRTEEVEPYFQVKSIDNDEISSISVLPKETVSRVHTRVLLATFGWPIKYFSTRGELLRALLDAIKGHRYLYEHGVLHRDISSGNVLITWKAESESISHGCLIDLDRAKQGKLRNDSAALSPNLDAEDLSDVEGVSNLLLRGAFRSLSSTLDTPRIDNVVAFQALKMFSKYAARVRLASLYIEDAVMHAFRFGRNTIDARCTPEVLQWEDVPNPSFDFKFLPSEVRTASKTGTPPYTSGEILSNKRYFPTSNDVHHDAIHDMESFFWVFVHICLTRQGPGGERRKELSVDTSVEPDEEFKEQCEHIQLMVWCLFDGDEETLEINKFVAFTEPKNFEKLVVDSFHPYFDSLKAVALEWWSLLQLAYKYRAYEFLAIHTRVINILERALKTLGESLDAPDEASQAVLERREKEMMSIGGQSQFTWTSPKVPHTGSSRDFKAVLTHPPESPTPRESKKPKLMTGEV